MFGGFSTIKGIYPIGFKSVLLIPLLLFYTGNFLIFKHDTSISSIMKLLFFYQEYLPVEMAIPTLPRAIKKSRWLESTGKTCLKLIE